MSRTCHLAQGQSIALGRELGRGGEGVVYALPEHPELVAKLYHVAPAATKQAKLRLMADSIDSPLRNYAAWPEETLHDAQGAVIGFTMQRIDKRLPIHMLYSPAQRREFFPNVRFDFLVFVARNIAAAFQTLHAHGHVLGDVNQGNVLVGEDSRVILIDCDSFQIQVGDALHRCEVGVAHFTPPELQSVSSFEDVTRTANHDGFGLALLIFHLLMGGRHPYSGVPLADTVGESLEGDIRDYRYAYSSDAAQRLIAPPPKSVPIASLPLDIVDLFERAFTASGSDVRPDARQWVTALDALRSQLKSCANNALHVFPGQSALCVWCALERRHLSLFGDLSRPQLTKPAGPTIDVAAMERFVATQTAPTPVSKFDWPQWPVEALEKHRQKAAWPGFWYLVGQLIDPEPDRSEWTRSQHRYELLLDRIGEATAAVEHVSGYSADQRWRAVHRRWRLHMKANARAMASVSRRAHQHGLRQALAMRSIDEVPMQVLLTSDRLRLRASGIETAADFDAETLQQLRFIPNGDVKSLLEWRAGIVRDYQREHRAAPEVVEAERARARKQRALEQELLVAWQELQRPPADPDVLRQWHDKLSELKKKAKAEFNRWNRITGRWLE